VGAAEHECTEPAWGQIHHGDECVCEGRGVDELGVRHHACVDGCRVRGGLLCHFLEMGKSGYDDCIYRAPPSLHFPDNLMLIITKGTNALRPRSRRNCNSNLLHPNRRLQDRARTLQHRLLHGRPHARCALARRRLQRRFRLLLAHQCMLLQWQE
jgi:hypothetical protein